MSGASIHVKRILILVHRWLGVIVCLPFLCWFSSGIVLMYCDYPTVSDGDRFIHEPILDASRIHISPSEAYARLKSETALDSVRLVTFNGRPLYRFRSGASESMVYADNGELQGEIPADMARRIASHWTSLPINAANSEVINEPDQWTVSGAFRPLRPLLKFSWPNGEQVYVSQVTGEVVQYTTRSSRLGAYFGAIPHWLYFTRLRKHAQAWSRFVIWLAGAATGTAVIGVLIGIWTYLTPRSHVHAGKASGIPYYGTKRWHVIFGLGFGVIACSWAFSGMLSMDPFPRLQGTLDEDGARMDRALRGRPIRLPAFDAKLPQLALEEMAPETRIKELALTSFDGDPIYLAATARDETRIIPVHGEPTAQFEVKRIVEALRNASQPATLTDVRVVTRYEAYYIDRHRQLPLPVVFARLNDGRSSMYYVNLKTGRIVESYDSNSRWNRWLYHGLHSHDLPWLYEHRPAWDILVLFLMLGGATLSVTGVILAFRVLFHKPSY